MIVSKSKPVRVIARPRPIAAVATVAVAAFATGCGGGSTPTPAAASPSQSRYRLAVSFSECMRAHGVPNFPDPTRNANGGISLALRAGGPGGLSPNSPAFQSAQQACQKLLPKGGAIGNLSTGQKQQFLDYAACMRTHGVPSFPDPSFIGGGVRIRVGGAGVDPSSPAFKAAQTSCRAKLPNGAIAGG
jgi:hypothetical protein